MRKLPDILRSAYVKELRLHPLTESEKFEYQKWLRFYLDFCDKYDHPPREPLSLPRFIEKIRSKNQSEVQQQEAAEAVKLFYKVVKEFE